MRDDPVGTGGMPPDWAGGVPDASGSDVRLRPERKLRPPTVMLLVALAVTLLCLIPLGFILYSTLTAGWDTVRRLIFRPRVGELLVNTWLLVVLSCTATAVIGTAAAYLVERARVAGHRFWGPLLVAPLAIPAFVTSYGWISVFPGIDGLFGATLIMTLAYFPFVYLPVAAACAVSIRRGRSRRAPWVYGRWRFSSGWYSPS